MLVRQIPAMPRTNPLALLLVSLTVAFTQIQTAQAADGAAGTGTITGRVQNVATGQYLNNARIALRGSDRIVFTDESGTFRLSGLPGGPAVLEVFFTGRTSNLFLVGVSFAAKL
jgi:hypothetical protein